MTAETIIGLVIISLVAGLMVLIGLFQWRKRGEPVGFYNVTEPPGKDEITDIPQWNRRHGLMWMGYGLCIEAGFWLGYAAPAGPAEVLFTLGGVLLPLPLLVLGHKRLEKKYQKS